MHAPTFLSARRLIILVASLALALVATPALASPPDVEVIDDEFSFVDDDFCGSGVAVQVDVDLHVRSTAVLRGRDQVVHFVENVRVTEVFTNVETGDTLTHDARILFTTLDVQVGDDGLLTVTELGTGADVWRGPDNRVVYNDPGQVRSQFVVDSNGTLDDASDDSFVTDLGRVFGSTGRNDLQGVDFCDAVLAVIG